MVNKVVYLRDLRLRGKRRGRAGKRREGETEEERSEGGPVKSVKPRARKVASPPLNLAMDYGTLKIAVQ